MGSSLTVSYPPLPSDASVQDCREKVATVLEDLKAMDIELDVGRWMSGEEDWLRRLLEIRDLLAHFFVPEQRLTPISRAYSHYLGLSWQSPVHPLPVSLQLLQHEFLLALLLHGYQLEWNSPNDPRPAGFFAFRTELTFTFFVKPVLRHDLVLTHFTVLPPELRQQIHNAVKDSQLYRQVELAKKKFAEMGWCLYPHGWRTFYRMTNTFGQHDEFDIEKLRSIMDDIELPAKNKWFRFVQGERKHHGYLVLAYLLKGCTLDVDGKGHEIKVS